MTVIQEALISSHSYTSMREGGSQQKTDDDDMDNCKHKSNEIKCINTRKKSQGTQTMQR